MTCKEIITEYLKENGYDGLYDDHCCCELDDLMPCGEPELFIDCKAGYKRKPTQEEMDAMGLDDTNWFISETKPCARLILRNILKVVPLAGNPQTNICP